MMTSPHVPSPDAGDDTPDEFDQDELDPELRWRYCSSPVRLVVLAFRGLSPGESMRLRMEFPLLFHALEDQRDVLHVTDRSLAASRRIRGSR